MSDEERYGDGRRASRLARERDDLAFNDAPLPSVPSRRFPHHHYPQQPHQPYGDPSHAGAGPGPAGIRRSYPGDDESMYLREPKRARPNLSSSSYGQDRYHNSLPGAVYRDPYPSYHHHLHPPPYNQHWDRRGGGDGAGQYPHQAPTEPDSFKVFLSKQEDDILPEEAQKRYQAYKLEFMRSQPNYFFLAHKDEEWFREKYDPRALRARAKRIRNEAAKQAVAFANILKSRDLQASIIEVLEAPPLKQEKEAIDSDHDMDNQNNDGKHDSQKHERDEENDVNASLLDDNMPRITLFLKNIPPFIDRAQLTQLLQGHTDQDTDDIGNAESQLSDTNVDGNEDIENIEKKNIGNLPSKQHRFELLSLRFSDPNPTKNYYRLAWAKYSSEDMATKALEFVNGKELARKKKKITDKHAASAADDHNVYKVDAAFNTVQSKRSSLHAKDRVLPKEFSDEEQIEQDLINAKLIMNHLDKIRKIDSNALTDEFLNTLDTTAQKLDYCIAYLRYVHFYCYYTCNESPDEPDELGLSPKRLQITTEENQDTASIRKPSSMDDGSLSEAKVILKRIEDKVKSVLSRTGEKNKAGAADNEELIKEEEEKWIQENTLEEGPGRFRCKLPPNKLFRGPEFVRKHLLSKHFENLKERLNAFDDETYRTNYENDAAKNSICNNASLGAGASGQMNGGSLGRHTNQGQASYRGRRSGQFPPSRPGAHSYRGGRPRLMEPPGPLDPRATFGQRQYHDLDAPAQGPKMDLVRFDDDI